jgi:YfiH family protein
LFNEPYEADASVTNTPNEVLAILTADCMPVLFASKKGDVIGAAHAGWRGLSGGVLENTIREMCTLSKCLIPEDISVWMGPAIGPTAFEVGEDVLQAFSNQSQVILSEAFKPVKESPGKYLANLYLLAEDRLRSFGIEKIYGGDFCTVGDPVNFYSYRRDKKTGRFASLIWISDKG